MLFIKLTLDIGETKVVYLLATIRAAAGFLGDGFLGKDGNADDARSGGFKSGDPVGGEVLGQDIIWNGDDLFFLERDLSESCCFNEGQVVFRLDGPGDAAGIHFGGLLDLRGQIADQDNVGYAEMAAGFEDAMDFLEDAVFVWDEVQDSPGRR